MSDDDIKNVVVKANLDGIISKLKDGLETSIKENNSIFSVGQK
jgi:ABC-type multidrug transport system fused ATPase/permease subunit